LAPLLALSEAIALSLEEEDVTVVGHTVKGVDVSVP